MEQGGESAGMEIVLLPVPAYQKNISLARLRSHRAYGTEFARKAAACIANDPGAVPDVIHLSAPPLDCIEPAFALREQHGCRVTVDIMDLWPETFYRTLPKGLSLLGKWLFAPLHRKARRAYREADGVSAVSQEYLELVAEERGQGAGERGQGVGERGQGAGERGHSSEEKTTHRSRRIVEKTEQFNQADLHLCYVGGELIDSAPRAPSPAPHAPTFIYVGAMTPTYDLDTILEATAHLKGLGLRFKVVFAGSGISEAPLKAKANDLGLSDTVQFLGFLNQDALGDALSRADVGLNAIMPGTFITMPHKLSDYLCAGLAVINSTAGEADNLLSQHSVGVFYKAGNVASLADAMKGYMEQPEQLSAQKQAASELAAQKFDRRQTYPALAKWVAARSAD
jgi:glycosyltransferase involved in cell wall biosynthesis